MQLIKQSTATHVPIYITLDDHLTPATGLTSGSFSVNQISKNAAAFGALSVTITERAYGWYDLTLASGDCDTLGALVLHFEGTGIDPVDVTFQVVALDFTLATITLTDGSITAAKFAANAITASVIATDAIDADALKADAVTEIQSGLATASAVAGVQSDTDNIQTRLPAALVGGRMDSTAIVTEVSSGAIAEASFQDGALTAAKVEADTYQAIASYVWEEDTTTHTNPDTFGKYLADLWNGFGGTTLGDILDGINNVPSSVWTFAHESGRTAKGVLVRLDALMTGKATGLLGTLATIFRADGTTKAIEATQNVSAGTRETASTIGGD